jgi:hypothetical protein
LTAVALATGVLMSFLSRFYVWPVRPLGLDISITEPARGQMRAGAVQQYLSSMAKSLIIDIFRGVGAA